MTRPRTTPEVARRSRLARGPPKLLVGMDTFNFRSAPVPMLRRLDPRALRLAILAFLVVLAVGVFARWVIASERASQARVVETGDVTVQTMNGLEAGSAEPVVNLVEDAGARRAVRAAMAAARRTFDRKGTFADAGPGQLTALVPGLTFVDGPSVASEIVSVATTGRVWAAAILAPSGTCYYLRTTASDAVSYGTGSKCTGTAALTAAAESWPAG